MNEFTPAQLAERENIQCSRDRCAHDHTCDAHKALARAHEAESECARLMARVGWMRQSLEAISMLWVDDEGPMITTVRGLLADREGQRVAEELVFRTSDAPTANGRTPQVGEHQWNVFFPLDDGRRLTVLMGNDGMANLEDLIHQKRVDDVAERARQR